MNPLALTAIVVGALIALRIVCALLAWAASRIERGNNRHYGPVPPEHKCKPLSAQRASGNFRA